MCEKEKLYKIALHRIFTFKMLTSYIIQIFKNIRLWTVEKCSTQPTHCRVTCSLAAGWSTFIHRIFSVFCICCSGDHKNIISSLHVAKCQPRWRLSYHITVKSELNEKLTEWTDWQHERQHKHKCAMHSLLPAELWNPKCTTQSLCSALSNTENV